MATSSSTQKSYPKAYNPFDEDDTSASPEHKANKSVPVKKSVAPAVKKKEYNPFDEDEPAEQDYPKEYNPFD